MDGRGTTVFGEMDEVVFRIERGQAKSSMEVESERWKRWRSDEGKQAVKEEKRRWQRSER